jgi:hypothetical protein
VSRLFNRTVSVRVTKPEADSLTELSSTTTEITGLRVTFQVEKHLGKEPNTCTVTVYNLAEETRQLFQSKPLHVRLEAGYDGETALLFAGDVRWAQSKHVGVDWETVVELADGDRAFRHARITKAFTRGVKARAAVINVIQSMGFAVPAAVRTGFQELDAQYASGLALAGASSTELSRLLEPYGLTWSIQDGRVQILRERDVRSDVPIEISADAGMVGTPELAAPEKPGKKPTLTVESLIYPTLTPGGRIDVRSRSIRGIFKVQKVRHTGDTHGSEWLTSVEAIPLG